MGHRQPRSVSSVTHSEPRWVGIRLRAFVCPSCLHPNRHHYREGGKDPDTPNGPGEYWQEYGCATCDRLGDLCDFDRFDWNFGYSLWRLRRRFQNWIDTRRFARGKL